MEVKEPHCNLSISFAQEKTGRFKALNKGQVVNGSELRRAARSFRTGQTSR